MMMYIIIGIACLVGIIVVVLLLPNSGRQQQKGQKYRFELSAGGGRKITFADPFDNFLVYGGANSGKTKSIGKPLLSQYIQAGFAGFVYNYKDFDLARTAVHLVKKHNYPYGCFQISFTDMERTHRTNPIRPSVVKNETLFLQLMDDMLTAYQGKDGKRDEWFNGALGILRGVSIRFYNDYPQFCTIPHIVNFICSAGTVRITSFLEGKHQSRVLAGAFLDGKYSINSLVYWVTYVHNVVYSFYRSMIYCYINSTQRCAGSIVIDIIPTNGADKRKFFPFAPYFPVTNVIKRYFYPYFPAIIGIKGYSFPYFPYLSGIMKIKTALYSLFSRLDWHKTVVFPCLGEIYEGIRSLSWEIPVT